MKSSSSSSSRYLDPGVIASALLKSSEWKELASQLQQTHGGGPAVFSLALRSLVEASLWKVNTNASNTASATTIQELIESLKTVTWEKLHIGAWHQVQVVWRDVYALASILSASLMHQTDPQAALVQLDLGLLMGGDAFRGYINPMIDSLVSNAPPKKVQGAALAAVDFGLPPENPIPLPPASLQKMEYSVAVTNISDLSLMHFAARYMGKIPIVIKQALDGWPAKERWANTQYLMGVAGPRTVPVEIGRHYLAPGWSQKLMLFSDFLKGLSHHREDNGEPLQYLAQHDLLRQIPALAKDVVTPEYCVALSSRIQSVNCWFGPAGTVTPLHTDKYHNFLCQVVGRKYVRLYSNDQNQSLYPFQGDVMTANASMVDLDAPDHEAFPLFTSVPFLECVLESGDALYIPPLWWHYVKSLTSSASVSFWWDAEGCTESSTLKAI